MFDNLKKQASESTDVTHVCQNGNGIISNISNWYDNDVIS